MRPKGRMLIIGGAEDIGDDMVPGVESTDKGTQRLEILMELMNACRNKQIEIVTTASKVQDEVKKRYRHAFHQIGYPNPGFIDVKNRFEAKDAEILDRLKKAGSVFFAGGDQFRLSTILGGTEFLEIILEKYWHDRNFLVAGTSAGAMAMSEVMISEGGTSEALIYRDVMTVSGLGFLRNCIIDTHFIKRGRFARLAHAIIINPNQLGIGLGEDTALIIKNGSEAECRGSGMVVIIDGKEMGQTNITDAKAGEAIFVENLKIHLLVKGCRFSIDKRQLYQPAISRKKIPVGCETKKSKNMRKSK